MTDSHDEKLESDTPRTDAMRKGCIKCGMWFVLEEDAEELERELAGAEGRIREIEEDYERISSQLAAQSAIPEGDRRAAVELADVLDSSADAALTYEDGALICRALRAYGG